MTNPSSAVSLTLVTLLEEINEMTSRVGEVGGDVIRLQYDHPEVDPSELADRVYDALKRLSATADVAREDVLVTLSELASGTVTVS